MNPLPTLLALLLAMPALLRAAEPPLPGPFPFFAMDTAVRSLDPATLAAVKQSGYAGLGWKAGPPERLAAEVKGLRDQQVKLFAVYAGATLLPDRLDFSKDLERDMEVLKGTGALIWLPIYSKAFACSDPAGDAVAVPALQRLAGMAAENGLRLAFYPHKGAWLERVQDAVRLAQKVNLSNVGASFNLCHCLMMGDEARIPELLEAARPHLFVVTINGADTGAAGTTWDRLIRPLDEGTYDVGVVLRKLSALNWHGPIGLQGYGVKIPVQENLRRSGAAWQKLTQPDR